MFKSLFSFQGRIRRLEFLLSFALFYFFLLILAILIHVNDVIAQVAVILFLPITWCFLSQAFKRSHDLGNSGWFILMPYYIILLLFMPGIKRNNEYGPDPKNPNGDDDLDEIGRHLVE